MVVNIWRRDGPRGFYALRMPSNLKDVCRMDAGAYWLRFGPDSVTDSYRIGGGEPGGRTS